MYIPPGALRLRFTIAGGLLVSIFTSPATAICYGFDGSELDVQFAPCGIGDVKTSMCCATNRTNFAGGPTSGGPTRDICLPNGLCQNEELVSRSKKRVEYWRNGCTTKPFDDKLCLGHVCTESWQTVGGGSAIMSPCDGTPQSKTWCCRNDTSCCGTDLEVTLAPTIGVTLPSSTISSNSVSSSARSSSAATESSSLSPSSESASPSSSTDQTSSLSIGAIAGIVISAGIALLASIAVLLFWMRSRKRERKLREELQKEIDRYACMVDDETKKALRMSAAPIEMNSWDDRVFELDGDETGSKGSGDGFYSKSSEGELDSKDRELRMRLKPIGDLEKSRIDVDEVPTKR